MAFGYSGEDGKVVFSTLSYDEDTCVPIEASEFYERVQAWCESHSIILGEGYVEVVVDMDRERGHDILRLEAPRIAGPVLHEFIPDTGHSSNFLCPESHE